jgi:hypothetical protein
MAEDHNPAHSFPLTRSVTGFMSLGTASRLIQPAIYGSFCVEAVFFHAKTARK